jgi:hypothetical protein
MRALRPINLILKCYGHRTNKGNWVGVCLELNLAVEADSPDLLRKKMSEAIQSYVEVLLDTNDSASIPELLSRPAPPIDWAKYYLIRFVLFVRRLSRLFIFKESIPFHLAHNC